MDTVVGMLIGYTKNDNNYTLNLSGHNFNNISIITNELDIKKYRLGEIIVGYKTNNDNTYLIKLLNDLI